MKAIENCAGACCRNPFGTCYCKRECGYHEAEVAARLRIKESKDFIHQMSRAGSLNKKGAGK